MKTKRLANDSIRLKTSSGEHALEGVVHTLRFTRGYDCSKKPPDYSVVFYRIIFAFIGNPNFILQISPLKCLLR